MVGRGLALVLTAATALVSLTGCAPAVPASIGSARYDSTRVSGDADLAKDVLLAPVTVWFEQENGELDLIAAGPVNTSTVPVSVDGSVVVPGEGGVRTTAVGCGGGGPRCTVDSWLAHFVSERLTYRSEGSTLLLTDGAVSLALRRE